MRIRLPVRVRHQAVDVTTITWRIGPGGSGVLAGGAAAGSADDDTSDGPREDAAGAQPAAAIESIIPVIAQRGERHSRAVCSSVVSTTPLPVSLLVFDVKRRSSTSNARRSG
jgi:hypothetical protein